jgi:hypothetical protein
MNNFPLARRERDRVLKRLEQAGEVKKSPLLQLNFPTSTNAFYRASQLLTSSDAYRAFVPGQV